VRELQSILNNYISNTEKQKRHLAVLVTLSLLVSFIVPYILVEPADSLTKDSYNLSYYGADILSDEGKVMVPNLNGGQTANNNYSPGQLSEVTLLIGDGVDWAEGCLTADDVIEAAKREYFLGIASDFCVFLEGDFNPATADSEGRVAVGGDIKFSGAYNYQIGNGDYTDGTPLKETDNYKGVTNYAHAIVNGTVVNINTISQGKLGSDSYYYPLDGDLYKRIVIGGNINDCKHYSWSTGSAQQVNYSTGCQHDTYNPNEVAQFYQANLINFEETFDWLEGQSEKLSKKTATGSTSTVQNGVITFTGPGTDSDAVTIYFNLSEWDPSINQVRFDDVPEKANLVVNCGGNIVKIGPEGTGSTFSTYINGEVISKTDSSGSDVNANNKKESEQILYNFYECGTDASNLPIIRHGNKDVPYSLFVNVNFNGTVLAPHAIVASDEACRGHISGALIAQTFTGGLEFGYRPYRGTTDILGSTAGYVVPFDKLAPNNKYLEGATFVIIDENGKTVESWKSGEDTQYITLPSEVDLEGGTDYTAADAVTSVTHSYTVEEQSAPEGYIKTDEFYTIVITETIDTSPDALIRTESGTLPTRILVYLDLYKGEADDANLLGRRVVTIEDTYSDEGIIQRIVCIENESAKQYFVLDINSQDGSINSVGVPTDPSVLEDDEVESVLDDLTVDYLKPEVLEDEETGDGTDGEGTDSEDTDDSTEGEGAEGETSLFPEGYIEPTGLTATYGQTLADVAIPALEGIGSWSWIENWQTVGDVGTKTFRATFTPTVEGYTHQEVQLEITVEPATPTPPGPYTVPYGTYLYNIQLPSDANGSWSWQNSNQTGNNLHEFLYQANYTPNNGNYKAISVDVSVTFTKSDPPYNLPNNLTATYGQTLADVTLPYADNGTWSWQADTTTSVGPAGTNTFIAVFTPNDTNYNTVTPTVQITVNKADPKCTFPTDRTAIYGQTLQNVSLPTADNGRFEWENPWNQVGNVGTNNHRLKFVPNDQNNYNTLTQDVPVRVEKADPNYTIPTGLTVTYGSKLSSVTLPSGWTWDAPDTDVPGSAGSTVTYSATFTPSDTNNYNIINADITLTIVQATPTVNPVYDKDTTYTQFDALPAISITEGDTPGTIQWSDKNASKLKYGENVLEWVFTPTDSTNYKTTTGTITITADAIETTPITITDSKTEEVIKHEEVNYYYDPTSMMIMPLPDETPKFINEYGLVFKKLDDSGNLLPGASISLESGTITEGNWVENTELSKPTWEWENGTSSSATIPVTEIRVNELNVDVVYRFLETAAPSEDYEIAEPIYFMKVDDSTIIYTQNEDELANTAAWTELNLNEGEYIIGMTDKGIYGAGITLVKTNSNGLVKLDGAKFELYAVGSKSDVLVYPLNNGEYFKFENGEVNLYEWFNSVDPNTYNSEYVQNGYLVPGGYYLYEVETPSAAYKRPDGPLYFTIEERTDADGKSYYEVTSKKVEKPTATLISIQQDSGNGDKQWWLYDSNGNPMNKDKWDGSVGIANVSKIIVKSSMSPTVYTNDGISTSWTYDSALEAYVCTFSSPNNLSKFEVQSGSWSSINIEYVVIEDSEGTVYTTDFSAVGTTIPDEYTISEITLSSIPPAKLISVRQDSGNGRRQWWLYDVNGNQMNQNDWYGNVGLESIVSVNIYTSLSPTIYANSGVSVSGTYNNSTGIYTATWSTPVNISKFEIQSGWNEFDVTKVEFTDSSGVKYTTDTDYVANAGAAQSGKPDLSIETLKVYYLDGTNQTYSSLTAGDAANGDGSYPFDISALTNRNDIVGMEVTLTGTGTGNIKIGDAWTISGAKEGTYTVGVTDYKPETSVEEGDTSHLVNASGTTLTIKNENQGQDADIIVKKSWVNDANFTNLRPAEIEVKLYRGTKADGSDKVFIGDITDGSIPEGFISTAILNEANKWQYTWNDLPSIYEIATTENGELDLENSKRYYYFAEETSIPDGYTVSYPTQGSTSGDYTITNTLNTINLPVEKIWDTKNNTGITIPDSVTIKLQKKSGDNWIDVDVEPIILNKDNNWKGTFENLPTGVTYRAFEENVPNGWLYSPDEVGTSVDGTTLTVTNNLDVGRLTISKIWLNDAASNRPGSIKLNIYRTTKRPGSGSTGGGTSGGGSTGGGSDVEVEEPENTKYATVTEDYARLLQYSLYFYDAQMCGDEVTEDSVIEWRDDCAVDYSSGKVSGGFHDAGDHIMFGLPQGFTASTLGWSYYEFGDAYDKLGLTTHYKHIMDEFCEFFVDSVKLNSDGSVNSLLVQKGDGSEHNTWGPPEVAVNHTSGETWVNNSGSEIAAQYAAALAQYVINFGDPGNYLDTAKALYSYSILKNSVYSCGEYNSKSFIDDQAWAAGWLYLATGIEDYKTFCVNNATINEYWVYSWDEVYLGAACMKAHLTNNWSEVNDYLTNNSRYKCTDANSYYFVTDWGSARYNAAMQMIALVATKNSDSSYLDWSKYQMAYLLGNNPANTCYVTGFTSNSAKYPHHRSASGYDTSSEKGSNVGYASDGHILVGALVGGPSSAGGSYTDSVQDYNCNEVALDYNVGLVGAAAGLYYLSPSGHTVTEDVMVADGLELRDGMHIYEYSEQPAALDLSDMDFSFDKVSVRAKEVLYDSITDFGTVTGSKSITLSYSNITRLEVDYTTVGSGGFNMTVNDGGFTMNNIDENTIEFIVPDWANGSVTKFSINMWNYESVTVHEIRLYTETEGATITLNPTSKTAKIGDTFQITATGTTNTINWTSSDTDVAEVDDNGNVTIKAMPKNGNTVRITATDSVDSSATAYIDVTIEAMTLSPNSSSIVVGDKVNYSSNYSNAVIQSGTGYSVSGNTITAESEGNHTVTAKAGNATATATINVSKLAITGSSTVDSGAKPTFGVNGQTDGHTFVWTSSDPTVLSIDNSGKAQAHKSGTVKLTVTKDGKYTSDEFSVTVQKGALSISVDPTQIRVGDTATLSAVNNEGQTVNYSSSDDNIATISGNTITAVGAGTVTITGTLGNENPTCTLEILAAPTITAPENQNLMGTGDKLQLTASNIIGTANWTSLNTDVLTVDPATGLVTAVSNGTAKIRVTDSKDNAFAEYEITVTLIADDPEIPEGLVSFMSITLTDADLKGEGTWSKILENLPKTDGNGNKYYYYIAELDSSGQIAESITGTGAIYIPMLYEGNGSALGDNTELSVSNKLTQEIQGQMPSTGGEGTEPYYIYGIILMLCSLAGYVVIQLRRGRRS